MMKKIRNSNQKGVTLIELLAALALFGLIGAIAITFLIQANLFHVRTGADISLTQEANLVVSELRSIHQREEMGDSYTICIEDGYLFHNHTRISSIPFDSFKIYSDKDLVSGPHCEEGILRAEALPLSFTIVNKSSSYDLLTTLTPSNQPFNYTTD
ncbi:prepilin-type N-terminal cleavage/methylation domain-containing protein [Alteribacter keqinensis]|uniref:Prepilin-type N-terminal cleavage/methylation domain-containing protein n=2 Tax=Alteribacter keqinensis TaxID=2483800 RepID=A0A3M7TSP6_9BACI|nr:prepilin-type N-terminal cleavage/methylation domain-containing protein [Alteribacter keqinensis]